MTDDLLKRLRDTDHNWHEAACHEAADRIEAQAAEIERLREALKLALDTHDVSYEWESIARAALEDK